MIAKYAGACVDCGATIEQGDEMWYDNRKTYCMDCKPGGSAPRGGHRNDDDRRPPARDDRPRNGNGNRDGGSGRLPLSAVITEITAIRNQLDALLRRLNEG